MTLGEYIKKYRETHDISQRKFADICGVSNGYISMLENGKNPKTGEMITPKPQQLLKIARAMGTTMQEMIESVDEFYLDISDDDKVAALSVYHDNEKQPSVSEGLSEDELMLIQAYRALPADERQHVLSLLRLAAGQDQKDPASV